MKTLAATGIIFFLFSCHTNVEKTKYNSNLNSAKLDTIVMFTEKDTFKVLSGDWKYTFDMYSKSDSLEINNLYSEPFIKMFTINNQKTGIVIENSLLKLYHFKNGYFQQTSTDSLEGINWKTTKSDLNFDGNEDIVLSEIEGAHGNSFTTALIFDSKINIFKHNKSFDLPNLTIDKRKKNLRSKWFSSACGNSKKSIYQVQQNDSVILFESISYFDKDCGENKNKEKYVLFTEKRIKNRIIKDSIKTKMGWEIFQKQIWNTEKEW